MSHQAGERQVLGARIAFLEGGSGAPLLLIHHDTGSRGWGDLHERLSNQHRVIAPDLPGYGESELMPWARSVGDFASVMHGFLDELGIDSCTLVGLGFGGWVAAEMAVQDRSRADRLVLAAPMGVRPRHGSGQIADQMLLGFDDYITDSFSTKAAREQLIGGESTREDRRAWNVARVTTARVAWKPYMWSRTLVHLLPLISAPTVVLHGEQDHIVPIDCSEQYVHRIPNAELRKVAGAGHFISLEAPDEIVAAVGVGAGAVA